MSNFVETKYFIGCNKDKKSTIKLVDFLCFNNILSYNYYSTVTDFAKFFGLSISQFFNFAVS